MSIVPKFRCILHHISPLCHCEMPTHDTYMTLLGRSAFSRATWKGKKTPPCEVQFRDCLLDVRNRKPTFSSNDRTHWSVSFSICHVLPLCSLPAGGLVEQLFVWSGHDHSVRVITNGQLHLSHAFLGQIHAGLFLSASVSLCVQFGHE